MFFSIWAASNRLRKHDALAAQQREINELDILARKAAIDNLERQKRGVPAPLDDFAKITRRRQDLEAQRVAIDEPASDPLWHRFGEL
jgi:hypothetical protein